MKIALACGGTGGHFFPGLATAEVLRERGHEVTLWLSGKNVEQMTVKAWTGPVITVQSQGFESRNPIKTVETILKLGRAMQTCVGRMKSDRPSVLLAMGSYAAVGPVGAALRRGVPYVLHESNVYPGRAVALLARSARAVAGYFDETRYHLSRKDISLTGMPLRRDLVTAAKGVEWGPKPGRPFTVLIMGGSKGAEALNDIGSKAVCMAHLKGHDIRVIHLTGDKMSVDIRGAYESAGVNHEVHAFTHNMASVYAQADLAICRAGAATCAELCLFGMPALLVPYPFATNDHQTANARAMQKTGAADVVPQKDLSISWLAGYLITCAQTPQRLEKMNRAAKARAVPGAAEALASLVEQVGKEGNGKKAH